MNEPLENSLDDIENRLAEVRKLADEELRQQVLAVLRDMLLQVASLDTYLARSDDEAPRAHAVQALAKIEALIEKIQSAPYTYSPFFTYDRVPADVQSHVLKADAAVLTETENAVELLGPTLSADSNFDGILETVTGLLTRLDTLLEERVNAIMEFH